jgi:hypothetical protein
MLQIVTFSVSEEFMILCTALILRRCVLNALKSVAKCFWAPSVPSICFQTLLQRDFSFYFVQLGFIAARYCVTQACKKHTIECNGICTAYSYDDNFVYVVYYV